MKAIWLRQPWATLVAIGAKEWETRSAPPNGPMRPAGVRGMPGLAIEPGERIAIVASKAKSDVAVTGMEPWRPLMDPDRPGMLTTPIPFGMVVCTVVVAEALPIVQSLGSPDDPFPRIGNDERGLYVMRFMQYPSVPISVQLPYGDWTPGRWAWRLTDVEPVTGRHEPVVTRGNRQGVCEIEETWT